MQPTDAYSVHTKPSFVCRGSSKRIPILVNFQAFFWIVYFLGEDILGENWGDLTLSLCCRGAESSLAWPPPCHFLGQHKTQLPNNLLHHHTTLGDSWGRADLPVLCDNIVFVLGGINILTSIPQNLNSHYC